MAESKTNHPTKNKNRQGNGWEERGGYMAAKKQKLTEQFLGGGTGMGTVKSHIFHGIVIHVDGYTKPSSDELKRIMYQYGGHYEHYLSKRRVTHIIATSLPNSKITKGLKHCKVVKPEWITESVAAGRLLSYIPYQLYTGQTKIQQGMSTYATESSTKICNSSVAGICTKNALSRNLVGESSRCGNLVEKEDEEEQDMDVERQSRMEKIVREVESGSEESDSDNEFGRYTLESDQKQAILDDSLANISVSENEDSTSSILNENETEGAGTSRVASKGGAIGGPNHSISKITKSPSPNSKPHGRAGDPDYLNEFYNNSRLHHLSTWKSEWREYVNKTSKEQTCYPGRQALMKLVSEQEADLEARDMGLEGFRSTMSGKPKRVIMHVDMDCFFVSVGLRKRPDLIGKPVAVTHSKGQGRKGPIPGSDIEYEQKMWRSIKNKSKSTNPDQQSKLNSSAEEFGRKGNLDAFSSMAELASCSYEARQAGVRNGMFMGPAKKLCPDLHTIPYDFEGYQEVSKILYDTVLSYTHDIEAVSCDEMLVDCTDLLATTGAKPEQFASLLRNQIHQKTGCTASAGMGGNILLAKMATKKAKPNGQFYLKEADVMDFMKDQSVQNIPGVGWSMNRKLKSMGIITCGQLQEVPQSTLQREFGPKTGLSLYRGCRGQDERQIKTNQERKSVSAEVNYGIRFKSNTEADKFIMDLSQEVHSRLHEIGMKGKSVTLKLMVRREDAPPETAKFMGHGICNNISKSTMLPMATDDASLIHQECMTILQGLRLDCTDLRGIGIQVQKLESAVVGGNNQMKSQSILNFATKVLATKTSPHKPNGMETNSRDQIAKSTLDGKLRDPGNTVSHKSKSTDVQIDAEERHWTDTLLSLDREVSPDKTSPDGSSELYKHIENAFSTNQNTEEESCDGEGHFLEGAVCQDLLSELSRRKTANRFLPPLPTLDIPSTPEYRHLLIRPRSTCTQESTSVVNGTTVDYFPSPSQIDQDVLRELPPDIRAQVENEMQLMRRGPRQAKQRVSSYSEEPGCSHWTSGISPVTEGTSSIVPLPDLSQLDESCLNALPEDMQKEIQDAYEHQQQQKQSLQCLSNVLKSPRKSSPKGKSPRKTSPQFKGRSPGKYSPQFKVPKGRPGRGRPKKLDFHQRGQPSILTAVTGKQEVLKEDLMPSEQRSRGEEEKINNSVRDQPMEVESLESKETRVNLCGAVTIAEVRSLLKEWIHSSPEPEENDKQVMITYLQDLILDKNLEQVDLVIKFLKRRIKKMDNSSWETSFKMILSEVQSFMKTYHGAELNVC
ncbi:DNA repair protein REV1-like [Saccostrea echinata]|uniref:DNA repair protein REV1-like n=1 Tax=Saccostrea echinata TaxID=191078 RepID=UPI002A7EA749|nr:DNA repair protein REV1-like [Saccostrea echinata]